VATEIAASAAIAIKIGTRGEDPPSSVEAVGVGSTAGLPLPAAPLPASPAGLPCLLPTLPPPPEASSDFPDEPPTAAESESSEDVESSVSVSVGAVAPPSPFAFEDLAGGASSVGSLPPVTVGGASRYCTSLLDSA